MSAKPPHDWEVRIGQRRVLGRGLERRFLGDLFHHCMSISWPRLFAGFIFFALVINIFFSLAFYAVEGSVTGARAPGYWEIFFFTWQLLGTVSFGGFMPGNLYGQALATVEKVDVSVLTPHLVPVDETSRLEPRRDFDYAAKLAAHNLLRDRIFPA